MRDQCSIANTEDGFLLLETVLALFIVIAGTAAAMSAISFAVRSHYNSSANTADIFAVNSLRSLCAQAALHEVPVSTKLYLEETRQTLSVVASANRCEIGVLSPIGERNEVIQTVSNQY